MKHAVGVQRAGFSALVGGLGLAMASLCHAARGDEQPAGLILGAKRIWTGDPARPWAEAVAIRGETIVGVGSRDEVETFRGAKTKRIDWPDGFVLPGLDDAHGHMSSLGSNIDEIDLRGVASPDVVAGLVKSRLTERAGDGWIVGQNWDQSLWPDKAFPTAAALDAVAPDRPVWLTRVDGHAGWANSAAMRAAGVTKRTQPPSDGQIIRGADGEPTGVFIDGAMGLVTRAMPAPSPADLERRILAAQAQALAAGLTCVHDAGVSKVEADVYRQLDASGKLRIRVYAMAAPPGGGEVEFVLQNDPEPYRPGRKFEMRAIKLYADGAMGSRGALLFEPYADDPHNVGLFLIDPKVLEATVESALRRGWQVCTHAIGDKGNAMVLDAYAKALDAVPGARGRARLRIEHAQVVRHDDVARFRELGVIASMQCSHAGTDQRWADARLGDQRAKGAYAWRWFADANVPLALGSDFPVEIVRPYWGIFAAVTRQNMQGEPPGGWRPEQKLTMDEALRGHTAGAAYASFAEDRRGLVKAGMLADLTVIGCDPFRVELKTLLDAKVLGTIVGGEVVYSAGP